jgi:ribosomal RNA assembly protein
VRLDIDSESGSVAIEERDDPVAAMVAPDVIKAIGRGFKPETALSMLPESVTVRTGSDD